MIPFIGDRQRAGDGLLDIDEQELQLHYGTLGAESDFEQDAFGVQQVENVRMSGFVAEAGAGQGDSSA
ncbi:MAG: hypothetical protein Q9Q13_09165 [Acidobacteriota bacterium]|nr:hypothetical protein [Acidobacteriota bacterium]